MKTTNYIELRMEKIREINERMMKEYEVFCLDRGYHKRISIVEIKHGLKSEREKRWVREFLKRYEIIRDEELFNFDCWVERCKLEEKWNTFTEEEKPEHIEGMTYYPPHKLHSNR